MDKTDIIRHIYFIQLIIAVQLLIKVGINNHNCSNMYFGLCMIVSLAIIQHVNSYDHILSQLHVKFVFDPSDCDGFVCKSLCTTSNSFIND